MGDTARVQFYNDESGAITVEKSIVVAGIIGLVIAVFGAIGGSTEGLAIRAKGTMLGSLNTSNFAASLGTPSFASWASDYYRDTALDGWTSARGSTIELVTTRYPALNDAAGHPMIDLENDAGNSGIQKTFNNLAPNSDTYISISALDLSGENGFDVIQNGQVIGSVTNIPNNTTTYDFSFTTGSNPQTQISIIPHGRDSWGAYVGSVSVTQ